MKANKFYIPVILLLLSFSAANAQEFKTGESISEQLKKGTVPGTKISSEAVAKKTQVDTESKQKISVPFKQQLMNGTYPGLKLATAPATNNVPAVQADKTALASNDKPAATQASKPAAMPLMQEEKKKENPAPASKEGIKKEVSENK